MRVPLRLNAVRNRAIRSRATARSWLSRFRLSRSMYQGGLTSLLRYASTDCVRDRQRGCLRVVVDVVVARGTQLRVLLIDQAVEELASKAIARADAHFGIVGSELRSLVQPFPEHGKSDLPGRHVLHQIEHVVIAKEVGRLERGRLKTTAEGSTVLQPNREQVPSAGDRAGGWLEHREIGGILGSVGERREPAAELVRLPDPLPNRPYDGDHLPMRHPLATRARRPRPPSSCQP